MEKPLIWEYEEYIVLTHELYHTVLGIHILQLYFCFRKIRIVSNKSFILEIILVKSPLETVVLPPLLWLLVKFLRLNFL